MEQPMTLHWHSPTRDYSAMLTADLFGGWMLITTSGSRQGGTGSLRRKALSSYDEGLKALRALRHRHRREGREVCGTSFFELPRYDSAAPESRAALVAALTRVFELWGLSEAEAAALLGIEAGRLARYLEGTPLPADASWFVRAGHVLAINKALRLRLGTRAGAVQAWLRSPCAQTGDLAPLAAMSAGEIGRAHV
jgi:hypothetical protein